MRREAARPDPLGPLIASLHEEGRPRVWSLVVTVFGDAVAPRGGRIANARLAELLGRVGVGEGALRTALSRLVADGTLERDRRGRASFHRLSEAAAREVARASAVIYAPPPGPEGWSLGVGPAPPRALELPGGAWLSREPAPPGGVAVSGVLATAAGIAPAPSHAAALTLLADDLDVLDALGLATSVAEQSPSAAPAPPRPSMLRAKAPLAPLDAIAARMLLIHRWRRLALRWPDLPGDASRTRVAAAYAALVAPSEAWLDAALPRTDGTSGPVARRFG